MVLIQLPCSILSLVKASSERPILLFIPLNDAPAIIIPSLEAMKARAAGIQEERIYEWLGLGAELSDTVNSLFRRIGLMQKWSLMKAGQDVSDMEIKTELVETSKPARRGKKAKAAEAEATAVKTEAPAAEAKATAAKTEAPAAEAEATAAKKEAPAAEAKPAAVKTEAPAAEETPAEEAQAEAAPAEKPAAEAKTEESNS